MSGKENSLDSFFEMIKTAKIMSEMFKTGLEIGRQEQTYISEYTRRKLRYRDYLFGCFWRLVERERACG